MFGLPKEIVIWDSEFTAWSGSEKRAWTGPQDVKELIQIGAVRLRTSDLSELDSFEVLIKPVVNKTLSDYFIKLTGITQDEVNKKGILFKKAGQMFFDFVGSANLYSWNIDDFFTLAENYKRNNIVLPIEKSRFFDARMIFWKKGIPAENYHSSTIVEYFGQKPKYRGHSGLNDARTIVDGLRLLKAQQ